MCKLYNTIKLVENYKHYNDLGNFKNVFCSNITNELVPPTWYYIFRAKYTSVINYEFLTMLVAGLPFNYATNNIYYLTFGIEVSKDGIDKYKYRNYPQKVIDMCYNPTDITIENRIGYRYLVEEQEVQVYIWIKGRVRNSYMSILDTMCERAEGTSQIQISMPLVSSTYADEDMDKIFTFESDKTIIPYSN